MKHLLDIGGRRAAALRLATLLAIALAAVAAAAAGACLEKTPLGLLVSSRGGCGYTRIVLAVPPGLSIEVGARGAQVVDVRPLGWGARVLHTVDGVYVVPEGLGGRAAKFAPQLFNVAAVARVFLNGRPLVLVARVEECSGHSLHMVKAALLAAGAEVETLRRGGGRHSLLLVVTVDNPARLGRVYAVLAGAECVAAVAPASPLGGVEPAAGRLPAGALPDAPPTPYAVALRDWERSVIGAWNGTG